MEETLAEFLAAFENAPGDHLTTEELEAWQKRAAAHGYEIYAEKEYQTMQREEPCWLLMSASPVIGEK